MSFASNLAIKVVHGLEGVGVEVGRFTSSNIRAGQEAIRAGNMDTFARLGFTASEDGMKKMLSLNWFDRQLLVVKNFFASTVLLIEKGQVKLTEGYDDLIKFAKKHFPGAAKEAKDIKNSVADLKLILDDKEALLKVVNGRLKATKGSTKFEDSHGSRLLHKLMDATEDKAYRDVMKSLSKKEKKAFEARLKNQTNTNAALLKELKDNGKYELKSANKHLKSKTADAHLDAEAARLAKVQVLQEFMVGKNADKALLDKLVKKSPSVKTAIKIANDPKYKAMTLERLGKKGYHKAKFEEKVPDKAERKALIKQFKKERPELVKEMIKTNIVRGGMELRAAKKQLVVTEAQLQTVEKKFAKSVVDMQHGQLTKKEAKKISEQFKKTLRRFHKENFKEIKPTMQAMKEKGHLVEDAAKTEVKAWLTKHNIAFDEQKIDSITTGKGFRKNFAQIMEDHSEASLKAIEAKAKTK